MTPSVVEFWAGKRVLVTGHTGLKGAWLCLLLNRLGANVAGFALPPPTTPSLYERAGVGEVVRSTIGDIRDLDAVTSLVRAFEPEVVLHLAAQSVVLESYKDPIETYASNVLGTAHVLEAVRRSGARAAIVNVTTDKVYANRGWVWAYRENDALGGHDPYSNSKACAELVAQSYRASFFPPERIAEHGVALGCARAGNVVAGGDWTPHQLVPHVVGAFDAGEPAALRHPSAIRPWQHVLDCLSGYLTLAAKLTTDPDRAIGDWNFGPSDPSPVTVSQVAETLAVHWGQQPAWKAAGAATEHEAHELRLDSSKAERLLGWQCALSTTEALDWVGQWYRMVSSGQSARAACLAQIESFLARVGACGGAAA